jgi:hypothetical protein
MRTALAILSLFVAAMPLAFVVTLVLLPLWRWIEADFGIEAIGHSGPADWCYLTIYGLFVVLGLLAIWRLWRRGAAS